MDVKLRWGQISHPGNVRSRNEDALVAGPSIFAVADGMGGHDAGDVASAMTIETLSSLAATELDRSALLDAVRSANRAVTAEGARLANGMGTTLTGLAVTSENGRAVDVVVFNVGDSRTYALHHGRLERLTHDHSVVQELVDAGRLSADEAERHPDRNVITRSLGAEPSVEIDWVARKPRQGDRYLVCSDGLTKEVAENELAAVLAQVPEPQVAADLLLAAALQSGGRDNVTAIVVDVVAVTEPAVRTGLDDDTAPRETEPSPLDDDTLPRFARPRVGSVAATVGDKGDGDGGEGSEGE